MPENETLFPSNELRCRACLGNGIILESIFEQNSAEKLFQCAQIEIKRDDGFPQNICADCVLLLETAYKFKLLCVQSEQTLKSEMLLLDGMKPIPHEQVKTEMSCENDDDSDSRPDEGDTIPEKYDSEDGNDSIENDEVVKETKKKRIVKKKKKLYKTKNHQCDECGFLALYPGILEDHKRHIHQGLLIYKCVECPKAFARDMLLKNHIKASHTVNPVICDLCGKEYKNRLLLQYHRRKHLEEKKHKCELCPFLATKKSLIKRHMTTHTDCRQYVCNICEKSFRMRTTMMQHIKTTHDNLRPNKV